MTNTVYTILKFTLSLVFLSYCIGCSPDTKTVEQKVEKSTIINLLVGTYTQKEGHVDGKGKGVYTVEFDEVTGILSNPQLAFSTTNPSWLTVHPNGKYVYAVNETGKEAATVLALAVADSTPWQLINKVPAKGGAPCYLSVDPTGKFAVVANYSGGNVALFPIRESGALDEAVSVINHKGRGNYPRQEAPHAHFADFGWSDSLLYVTDLGLDHIYIYQLDKRNAGLIPIDTIMSSQRGSGPRHLTFHPTRKWLYAINELNSSVELFKEEKGQFQSDTLFWATKNNQPAGSAAIRIMPDGKYLYAINRDTLNEIVAFKINPVNGYLEMIGNYATGGATPRDFWIAPSGKWIIVANQDSGDMMVFERDRVSGELQQKGLFDRVPTPVCVESMK